MTQLEKCFSAEWVIMEANVINTIKKIFHNQPLTLEELNLFITSYVEKATGKTLKPEELTSIGLLLQKGLFNIGYAAEQYARLLNYQVLKVVDLKTNTIKRIDLYEL